MAKITQQNTRSLNSKDSNAFVLKGEVLLTLLDFKGALNSFNKAIKLDNNNDLAYNFKGISLFNLNDYFSFG